MNEEKQKVNYRAASDDVIVVGGCAYVYALNHPKLGELAVRTSMVRSYDNKTGEFETLNSIYTPAAEIKPSAPKPVICHKHG